MTSQVICSTCTRGSSSLFSYREYNFILSHRPKRDLIAIIWLLHEQQTSTNKFNSSKHSSQNWCEFLQEPPYPVVKNTASQLWIFPHQPTGSVSKGSAHVRALVWTPAWSRGDHLGLSVDRCSNFIRFLVIFGFFDFLIVLECFRHYYYTSFTMFYYYSIIMESLIIVTTIVIIWSSFCKTLCQTSEFITKSHGSQNWTDELTEKVH